MPGGRPTVMTPETISKLEHAFSMGCSDVEACLYAGIGKSTLYDHQERDKKFSERKEQLKESPALLARQTIYNNVSTDPDIAKWYLERKKKDEFGTKSEVKLSGDDKNPIVYKADLSKLSTEQLKKLRELNELATTDQDK